MLRRQARLRREYIYKKSIENRDYLVQKKKDLLQHAVTEGKPIPTNLRADAIKLQKLTEWDDEGAEGPQTNVDDEYRWAGVEDPKVMITTSRDPSSKLKQFAKEMKLIYPNSQRINRGNYEVKQLMEACSSNGVTDLIIVHEHRGVPDVIKVCHLPYGPTATFTLKNVVTRHEIPDIGTMSEAYPHLLFRGFTSRIGQRVMNILKYLFPPAKEDSRRVISFSEKNDYISFRHHVYKQNGKDIELTEVGPRFEMTLYKVVLGTLDNEDIADVEYVSRPFMNTARKRKFLSNPDPDE